MRKWLARLEGTIYWPHYEWQINSKPIEIKDVIAATISSYQQLLGVPVNKDFDIEVLTFYVGGFTNGKFSNIYIYNCIS